MSTSELTSVRSAGELAAMAMLPTPPPQPFAEDGSGLAYFSSDYHHRHLASVIFRQLEKGHGFVLVSADSAADGELLERFLTEEGKQRYRATLLRCQPGMDFGDIVRAYNRRLGLKQEAGSDGIWSLLSHLMLELRRGITRILVLANAEALDVTGFDELLRFTRLDQPYVMPVVMLAEPGFAEQLATPHFEFMRSAITGRIALDWLEPEEVGAFIRYQLNALARDEDALFPTETVAAIATASGGSPAEVNRLAREVLAAAGRRRECAGGPPMAAEVAVAPPEAAEAPGKAPAAAAEPLTLYETVAAPAAAGPRTAPERRGRRLPSSLGAAAYVLAVSLCGLGLLYLLAPRTSHEPPASVQAAAPAAAPAVDSPIAPAPDIATNEPPALPPATLADETPGIAVARSAAAIEPAAGEPVAAAAALDSKPAPSPDASDETSPAPAHGVAPAASAQDAAVAAAPPALLPATLADETPDTAVARSAAAIEPAAGEPVATAAALDGKPAPSPDAPAETPPVPATTSPAPAHDVAPAAPAQDAAVAAPPPDAQVATLETSPATPRGQGDASPDAGIALMVQRGDELLAAGDVVSARRFFERAALAGNAAAECGLAKTYDALFLHQIGARGISGDAAIAIGWYRRAAAAGSSEAMARLARLNAPTSSRSNPEERR